MRGIPILKAVAEYEYIPLTAGEMFVIGNILLNHSLLFNSWKDMTTYMRRHSDWEDVKYLRVVYNLLIDSLSDDEVGLLKYKKPCFLFDEPRLLVNSVSSKAWAHFKHLVYSDWFKKNRDQEFSVFRLV